MENSYIVYIHTLQNKKIYIGYLDMNSNFVDGRTFDEVMVSQLLNHDDIKTTYCYIRRSQNEMDDFVESHGL